MNLSGIDWAIVAASVVLIRFVSWSTRSLMRGAADFLSAMFVVVMALHFAFHAIPDGFWPSFWLAYLLILLAVSVPAVAWFTVGGVLDIRALLRLLRTAPRDPTDDGRVTAVEAGPSAPPFAVAAGRADQEGR